MKRLAIIFSVLIFFPFSHVYGQEIPLWVKNTAGWWAEDSINYIDFVKGIEFLINEGMIQVDSESSASDKSNEIPLWVKNSAGWWAEGFIDDKSFLNGIQYLVSKELFQ